MLFTVMRFSFLLLYFSLVILVIWVTISFIWLSLVCMELLLVLFRLLVVAPLNVLAGGEVLWCVGQPSQTFLVRTSIIKNIRELLPEYTASHIRRP
jgi:hypothetical protein